MAGSGTVALITAPAFITAQKAMRAGEELVMMSRPKDTAAELILQALNHASPRGMTYSELCERTALPVDRLKANVKVLAEQKKLQARRDGHGKAFVTLG